LKSKNEKYNKKKIDALNVEQEIRTYEERLQEQKNELERIDRTQTSLISQAQFKTDTDSSIYANMQSFLDQSFLDKEKYKGKQQIQSGVVVYENRTHKTEVVFEGNFEVLGNYSYTAQTEKIKDALEEILVTQYLETQRPTIFIDIKKLAKEINVKDFNLRKRIAYIMESLQTIRISYTTKGKLKNVYTDFASLRLISSFEYHTKTDILEVSFDDKYAYILASHNFYQLPKKYRQINDNSYPYAYHLSKYIYELGRENRHKVTFKSVYDRVEKIPRIEDLKKIHASPTQKIYEPLMKCIKELNSKEDFELAFENEDFLIQNNNRKNLDFDKMLATNIIIKWKHKPDYENLEKTKAFYQKKIINERAKAIAKAVVKKELNEKN